jgi:hypothetical protein
LSDGQYPSHGTCSTKACLDIGPCPCLCWGKRLCFADGTFLSHRVCYFVFFPRRPEVFLPIFLRSTSIRINVVNLFPSCVEACCTFFAFATFEWFGTYVLICYFPLLVQLVIMRHLWSAELPKFFVQSFECLWAFPD